MTTIVETCACGATVTINDVWMPSVSTAVSKWRTEHNCSAPPPGPCGDSRYVGGPLQRTIVCELRAGHAGLHEQHDVDGGHAQWRDMPAEDARTAARTPAGNEVAPGTTDDTQGPQNGSDAANGRPAEGDQ